MKNSLHRSAVVLVTLFASASVLPACSPSTVSMVDDAWRAGKPLVDDAWKARRAATEAGKQSLDDIAKSTDNVAGLGQTGSRVSELEKSAYITALEYSERYSATLAGSALEEAVQAKVEEELRRQAGGVLSEKQIQQIASIATTAALGHLGVKLVERQMEQW